MRLAFISAALASAALLSGCGALTGFSNAQTDFSCVGKDGEPSCRTISDVYSGGSSSAVAYPVGLAGEEAAPDGGKAVRTEAEPAGRPEIPWRTPEKVLRVWMAPFTDEAGDLHDQRYLYVRIKDAGWHSDAVTNLARSREAFRPVYPLKDPNAPANEEKKKNTLNPAEILPLLGKGAS